MQFQVAGPAAFARADAGLLYIGRELPFRCAEQPLRGFEIDGDIVKEAKSRVAEDVDI